MAIHMGESIVGHAQGFTWSNKLEGYYGDAAPQLAGYILISTRKTPSIALA